MRWYWFQSVTYKKQHLLDLRQPKGSPEEYSYRWGYSDISQRLIYANFNLLCIYIEKELGGIKEAKKWLKKLEGYQEKDEPVPEFQIKTIREAIALYEWWTIERSKRLAALRTLSDEWHAKRNTPEGSGLLDRTFKAEEAFENEINEKLKSIIDIRQGMQRPSGSRRALWT
jgi:hypothetical protein